MSLSPAYEDDYLTSNPINPAIEEFEKTRNAALKGNGPQCFKWSSDGCTKSPDKPFGCNFTPSCHRQ